MLMKNEEERDIFKIKKKRKIEREKKKQIHTHRKYIQVLFLWLTT